ncbi:MAG TPA: hypothetical protein VFQ61_26290 [Polyangiaceae bacterium]|nr:hypothetical protein [Polyangiaceae bacterium]
MLRLSPLALCLGSGLLLLAACEPDLDALTREYATASGGQSGSGGSGGTSSGGRESGGTSQSGGTGGQTVKPDTCTDQRLSPNESDVDCGGSSACQRCELNARCTRHTDCETGICARGRCSEPTCTDGVQNQDETGVDCGGSCAPDKLCEDGLACGVHEDCQSGFCNQKVCDDHCASKRLDGDETDVDCGGESCDRCPNDSACLMVSDCESGVCKNNRCVDPSCDDEVKNQDETDIDCGGVCRTTRPCGINDTCKIGADCSSYVCSERCVADITIPTQDMIDNFEDQDLLLTRVNGRVGSWSPFGDGSDGSAAELKTEPIPGRRAASAQALHYSGAGFTDWGSGFGFDFSNNSSNENTKKPWNASTYKGVTFWAKSANDSSFTLQLLDRNTHVAGGVCQTCECAWGKSLELSSEWQRYIVLFSELTLSSGCDPVPTAFDKSGVVMMQLLFSKNATADLEIDDVALLR